MGLLRQTFESAFHVGLVNAECSVLLYKRRFGTASTCKQLLPGPTLIARGEKQSMRMNLGCFHIELHEEARGGPPRVLV